VRCLLLVFGALAVAQEPMRVSTRLIETNVVVRDARGPVVDLTAGTFKIFEDGKEQRIAVFRVSKAPAEAVKVAPAGVYSNRIGGAAREVRYKVLLIDTLNTRLSDQAYVRSRMIEMLDRMEIHDPMAIYTMGGQFRVLQDFTTDAHKLKAAMEAFRPGQSQPLRMASTPTPHLSQGKAWRVDEVTQAAFQEMRDAGDRTREEMTVSAFEELASYLARVPGRKTLVWVSSGFPPRLVLGQAERWRTLERGRRGLSGGCPRAYDGFGGTE
jgi:VWFA-related protein